MIFFISSIIVINGSWGSWASWGACMGTCINGTALSNGTRTRTRLCNDPLPLNGGDDCASNETFTEKWNNLVNAIEQMESNQCNFTECPG